MFRFSIRELVLVTLIVALAAGWGMDRSRLAGTLSRTEVARKRAVQVNGALLEFLETRSYQADGFPSDVYSD